MGAHWQSLGNGVFVVGTLALAAFGFFMMLKSFGPLAVASASYPEEPLIVLSNVKQSS